MADVTKENRDLLTKAADALDDQMSPFTTEWLVEHDVSADECFTLSEQLAMGARLLVYVAKNAHAKVATGIGKLEMPNPEFRVLSTFMQEEMARMMKAS